ncbi:MAG: division/cell wall cluster transcriptional repressor MraZ [Thermodesulfobacteriota bacterium]
MFTGSHFHTMDNKGRVSIPARYREILRERKDKHVVLTNYEDYVLVFPQAEWIKFEEALSRQPILDKRIRNLQRFLISGAEECALDRQGRILISPNLRDYAKLSREVCVVGAVKTFEIWDRSTFESQRNQWKENIDEGILHELLI